MTEWERDESLKQQKIKTEIISLRDGGADVHKICPRKV